MPGIIPRFSGKGYSESLVVLKILVTAFDSAISETCLFKIGDQVAKFSGLPAVISISTILQRWVSDCVKNACPLPNLHPSKAADRQAKSSRVRVGSNQCMHVHVAASICNWPKLALVSGRPYGFKKGREWYRETLFWLHPSLWKPLSAKMWDPVCTRSNARTYKQPRSAIQCDSRN
jgi:hypothetical protein